MTDHITPRLFYDRAADSDPLRKRLVEQGIELVCPYCKGRTRKKTQDGRKRRGYARRWKIERTIAWLHFTITTSRHQVVFVTRAAIAI